MPVPRTAPIALMSLLACAATGCGGPRPARAFVEQARRLHSDALVSAVSAREPDLAEYVQLLGDRLVAGAREAAPDKARDPLFSHMKFDVVSVATPNVFTTGGDHVYVFAGLIGACENEEELAAAMAHALAHAVNLDVQSLPIRPDPRGQPPEAVAWQFVANRFNAQQEWAADKLAFAIYARAGWDPDRFGTLYTRLGDQYRGPTSVDRAPLSIRPEAARVSGVDPNRRWRKPPVADRRTFAELRDAARRLAASAPQGMAAEVLLRALPNCILPADQPDQLQAQETIRPQPPRPVPIEPN